MFGVHSINEHLRTLLSLLIEVILFNLSIKQSAFQIVKEHVCCLSTSTFLTVLDKNAEESGHFLYGLTEGNIRVQQMLINSTKVSKGMKLLFKRLQCFATGLP